MAFVFVEMDVVVLVSKGPTHMYIYRGFFKTYDISKTYNI